MSRGRDISDKDRPQAGGSEAQLGGGRIRQQDSAQGQREGRRGRWRPPTRRREMLPPLRKAERNALRDIGRFRAVDARDLGLSDRRLRALERQGLIQTRLVRPGNGARMRAVTLSRRARRLLQRQEASRQAFHFGFKQPRQLAHDAALFRLYRHEEAKILRQGGRVRRVVLDQEIKRRLYSDLNRASPGDAESHRREVAGQHGLKVVNGKIPIPDLRIEYESSDGREARVDLELVTEHYRPSQLAEKAQAGFRLYGLAPSSGEGAAVREERDRIAEIVSI